MMAESLLLDTNVLVDYLRDHPKAAAFLETQPGPLLVSVITVAELYAGVRESERDRLDAFLRAFEIVALDREAAELGGTLRGKYGRSHGVGLADALIAAQSIGRGATLITLNRKHFPMLKAIRAPYRKS